MEIIHSDLAPAAIGPYSQGMVAGTLSSKGTLSSFGTLVFTSGQIPINPATGNVVEGDISVQAEQSCKNVGEVLKAAGSDFSKVVKTTCFLKNMSDFAAFNEVYAKYFVSKPARSCVEVAALPKGVLCEIEAIAEK